LDRSLGNDSWIKIGNTASGQVALETFTRDLDLHTVYNETTATQTGVASGSTVNFQTVKTTVTVKDSDNNPLDGVAIPHRKRSAFAQGLLKHFSHF
jgi:hypothetical protein